MRLSVVIPVYNVAQYLPDCLGSVAVAARRLVAHDPSAEVEVVCVDDGSTDGSPAILDAYADSHPSSLTSRPSPPSPHPPTLAFRLIRQANAGVSAARNAGLDAATGDWILFVDSDDVVRETWLEDVAEAIGVHPSVDLVGFGQRSFSDTLDWREDAAVSDVADLSTEIPDRFVTFCVYQFAFRAAFVKGLRFPGLTLGEDLVFVANALARALSCAVLPREEYGYRYRAGSATHAGLSMRKLRDTVAFHVETFRALEASGKRIGPAFAKGRGRMWLEELPKLLLPVRKTPEGRAVWEAWLDSLSVAAELTCLTDAQRARARRVAAARSVRSVLWNFRFPAWLRRKGLAGRRFVLRPLRLLIPNGKSTVEQTA